MDNFLANLSGEEIKNLIHLFNVQISIVLILVVFLTKSFASKIILRIINLILKRKEKPQESELYKPIKLMYVVVGIYLAVKLLPVTGKFTIVMTSLLKSAIIIFIANIINNTIFIKDSIIFKRKSSNETFSNFVFKIARFVVWVIAFYIIIAVVLGFNQINGLVTGLGLGTVVISFAAQDTVKSLFSGFTILSEKPFVIGDWIAVGDYSGTVIDISFRSTRIKCLNNSIVTIPNSTITSDYVENWSRLKYRRFDCVLNLEMNITPEKIKKIIKELKTVISSKDYVKVDTVYVGFTKIADYSINIRIFANITETEYVKFLKIQEDLNCEFLNVLAKENVGLAYPTQTVHVKNDVENKNNETYD